MCSVSSTGRLIIFSVILLSISAAHADETKSYGIDAYVPLTTSRVTGSPEPPLPFRAVRAFPKLQVDWPIFVTTEPGSSRLIFIEDHRPEKKFLVCRATVDQVTTGEFDVLLEVDDPAYSICFHPDFTKNGYFYLGHCGPNKALPKGADKTCSHSLHPATRGSVFAC